MNLSALWGNAFFGIALTLGVFVLARWLQARTRLEILNPILVSAAIIIPFLLLLHVDFGTYSVGASWITLLLKPATVALAVPLYRQFELLKKNLAAVAAGVAAGCLSSAASVFLLCRLLRMPAELYRTLLPKSITSAIGLELSREIGGIPSLTAALIILTGVFGAAAAPYLFRLLRIRDPIARGLALGASSHAVGTVKALQMGDVEGAMSSLAIVTSGLLTVAIVPFISHLY